MGFDKSTVSKTVRDVTDALVTKAEHFIRWPVSSDARTAIKCGLNAQARFPNVIGCIDDEHAIRREKYLRESKGLPQHQCASCLWS